MFPSSRAHMSFIEHPSRSFFIGRSAASFVLKPPLELEARPVADVQSGFWDLALRTVRTAAAWLPFSAAETAMGFSSLRLADIQRTDVLMRTRLRTGHQPQVTASGFYPLLGFR